MRKRLFNNRAKSMLLVVALVAIPGMARSQDDVFGDSGTDNAPEVDRAPSFSNNAVLDSSPAADDLNDLFDEPRDLGGNPAAPARDVSGGLDAMDSILADNARPSITDARARDSQHQQKWHQLRQKVLAAEDEETRKQHGLELQKFLEGVFDEDLARREKELGKLEARLKKLRNSFEMRKTNRERIIGVRMDALMLDAQGLGLPGLGTPSFAKKAKQPSVMIDSLKVLGRNSDGSVAVHVVYTAMKDEERTRTIQKRSFRRRPGSNGVVPINETVQQAYIVQIPLQYKVDVIVPRGEDMTQFLMKQLQSGQTTGTETTAGAPTDGFAPRFEDAAPEADDLDGFPIFD